MTNISSASKFSRIISNWLITFAVILLSSFGIILSLVCIYALPDQSVRPLTGTFFYISGAIVVGSSLFFWQRKEMAATDPSSNCTETGSMPAGKSISNIILKWIFSIYLFHFVLNGVVLALICIYALPDQTSQPETGLIYFLSGSIVLGSFVFVVRRNRAKERAAVR